MKRGLLIGMGLVLVGGVVTPAVTPMGVDEASATPQVAMPFDFDGDGNADLAVSVAGEDLRGVVGAGAVQVMYGSAAGVTARDQLWHQGRKGIKNKLEKNDHFGAVLASGDFDADGYADLAVGIPNENLGSVRDAGAVQVLYGSAAGLTARDQVWHQGKPGVLGNSERDDHFGRTLAAGDFDADGYADLAIGVSSESVGSIRSAGRVLVLNGAPGGLTATGAQSWRQGQNGIASQPSQGEGFGAGLAVGDVNGDGHDDLAIRVAGEADSRPSYYRRNSAMHLLLGSPTGLTSTGSQYILAEDIVDVPDGFSFTLAFGDFNRDGRADLVLADVEPLVAVLHGHPDGLHPAQLSQASTPGEDAWWPVRGDFETWETQDVAVGDVTGDGYPDLVLGGDAHTVRLILGTDAGLGAGSTRWTVDPAGFPGAVYYFVEVRALSGGAHAWLVASQYYWNDDPGGAVAVLRGNPDGTAGPVTTWSQDSPGIKGKSEPWDGFGYDSGAQ